MHFEQNTCFQIFPQTAYSCRGVGAVGQGPGGGHRNPARSGSADLLLFTILGEGPLQKSITFLSFRRELEALFSASSEGF
jgi:hypothetical protein